MLAEQYQHQDIYWWTNRICGWCRSYIFSVVGGTAILTGITIELSSKHAAVAVPD